MRLIIRDIYDLIPREISTPNRRFQLPSIKDVKRFDQVREHFLWLSRAAVVEEPDGRLCALEVKSGGSYRTHAALDNALRAKEHSIDRVIVLAETNIEREGDILYAPIFLGGSIG